MPRQEEKEREDFENMDVTKGFDRLHLSKKLGEEHKNRDLYDRALSVRTKQVRHTLREKPEAHLAPALWSQVNAVSSSFSL